MTDPTANHDPMCGVEHVLCPTCENAPWQPWLDEPRRKPAWMERMQRDGLPPKDMTGRAA